MALVCGLLIPKDLCLSHLLFQPFSAEVVMAACRYLNPYQKFIILLFYKGWPDLFCFRPKLAWMDRLLNCSGVHQMIQNKHCAYCNVKLTKVENSDNCQSREHLIPNAALTNKRNNSEADFYACRKCNLDKSKMDYIIGFLAKIQSTSSDIALKAISNAKTKKREIQRFENMTKSAVFNETEYEMTMPFTVNELESYVQYLAKGLYFITYQKPMNTTIFMVYFQLINKKMMGSISESYHASHKSYPLDDLKKNQNVELILNGECILVHGGQNKRKHLIFLQDGFGLSIDIVRRTHKNTKKKLDYFKRFSSFTG